MSRCGKCGCEVESPFDGKTVIHDEARCGSLAAPYGSAVLCDMIGCREHATGEVQIGDEYIPLCEIHRKAEMDRLTPRWRPLPPHPPNTQADTRHE